jgi:hypothetical protein
VRSSVPYGGRRRLLRYDSGILVAGVQRPDDHPVRALTGILDDLDVHTHVDADKKRYRALYFHEDRFVRAVLIGKGNCVGQRPSVGRGSVLGQSGKAVTVCCGVTAFARAKRVV